MIIDSHHHFWTYDPQQYGWISDSMSILRQDFGPADLQSVIGPAGVQGVLSVQARQSLAENAFLLAHAARCSQVLGVVGWVPLQAETGELTAILDEATSNPKLKGLRHVAQDEPDDRFLVRDEFCRGLALLKSRNLTYDLLVYPKQLPAAIELADRFPEQIFVLDHIAKPAIATSLASQTVLDDFWTQHIQRLAQRPNVYCKFSGVVTEVRAPEWDIELIRPYWECVLEAFTPSRLMFGSDWPVCLLRTNYLRWLSTVQNLAQSLSNAEQDAFWATNATIAYRLEISSSPST